MTGWAHRTPGPFGGGWIFFFLFFYVRVSDPVTSVSCVEADFGLSLRDM
jgi:hypothetical protein